MPPMSDNVGTVLMAAVGFVIIGCLTWHFSSRRERFLKTFVPADERDEADRSIPVDPSFGKSMRMIALLQMGVGLVMALAACCFWWIAS